MPARMRARTRVERALLAGAMALPERVQRRLSGPALVLDGQTLAADVQTMLWLQRVTRERAAEALPIPAGRLSIARMSALVAGRHPIGSVRDLHVEGGAGPLPARLYVPSGVIATPGPLMVFFHGGGFMYGDLESHDAPCRVLAELSGVRILAIDYRLGPEHRFPAAYDDCLAAHAWALAHAADLGADPTRIGVGGDSAGGALSAGVALAAGADCAFQLLIYPATVGRRDTESSRLFGTGLFLTTEFMDLANASYARSEADFEDPRYAVSLAQVPAGLAPAYVATAGFDPLRDEGEEYAARLAAAGVPVEQHRFDDQIHGFLNATGVGRTSRAAVEELAGALHRLATSHARSVAG